MKVPRFISDVEGTYIPVLIGRVSSSSQRRNLPTQMVFLNEQLKARYRFKKKPIDLVIVQSGKEGELRTIQEMADLRAANPKKKYVAVFRDVSRIARDTENGLRLTRLLSDMGIPIIALNMSTLIGNKPLGDRSADLLYQINLGIAQTGKDSEQDAQQEGVRQASLAGITSAGVTSVDSDKAVTRKGKLLTPWRRLYDAKAAIANGDESVRDLSKKLGYISSGKKTRGEPNTSKPRKIISFLDALEEKGGKAKVLEYLDVIDELTRVERRLRQSLDTPKKDAKRATLAVQRVTRGYRTDPMTYPNPVTVGNPNIADFIGVGEGDGTVADALRNPKPYLPKK